MGENIFKISDSQFFAGAIKTNPNSGDVMVTTGPINRQRQTGQYILPQIIITSTVAATFKVQVWDGAAEVLSFNLAVPASDSRSFPFNVPVPLPNGDHVRILTTSALTGQVQANIIIGFSELYY